MGIFFFFLVFSILLLMVLSEICESGCFLYLVHFSAPQLSSDNFSAFQRTSAYFCALRPTPVHFSPLQRTSTHFSALQPTSAHSSPLGKHVLLVQLIFQLNSNWNLKETARKPRIWLAIWLLVWSPALMPLSELWGLRNFYFPVHLSLSLERHRETESDKERQWERQSNAQLGFNWTSNRICSELPQNSFLQHQFEFDWNIIWICSVMPQSKCLQFLIWIWSNNS